jgi:tRNA (uracil-5-)-methyltransferase
VLQVHKSPPENYRCRCEFSIWHEGDESNYVMYEGVPGQKRPRRTNILQYPIASKVINEMMPVVMDAVMQSDLLRRKLFQVNFHTTLSGQALVTMIYHKNLTNLESEWRRDAASLRCDLHVC